MPTYNLTIKNVKSWKADPAQICPDGGDVTLFDSDVAGFGLRVRRGANGANFSWWLKYRNEEGRQRKHLLGSYRELNAEQARTKAKRLIAEVVANGADPAGERRANREAMTVADLCRDYLAAAESGKLISRRRAPKKESTLISDRGRIERHIVPLLGKRKVAAVTKDDIQDFMDSVSAGETATDVKTKKRGRAIVEGGRGTAARTVGLLSGIFAWAIKKRLRADNPCHGIERPADGKRTRRLDLEEYAALGVAIEAMLKEGENPNALALIRFLALTGTRKGEAMTLTGDMIDLGNKCLRLTDSKTGYSLRPLGSAAALVLKERAAKGALAFPGRAGQPMAGISKVFDRATKKAGLAGVTLHTLRHSFASQANDLGMTESTIAGMIGHASGTITGRYIHNLDAVLIAAADKVAQAIDDAMRSSQPGKVIQFPATNQA